MQKLIENAIRKSLNRHLVQHVNVLPDKRCRVDIMVEEATNEILKLVVQPDVIKPLPINKCNCSRCTGLPDIESYYKDEENEGNVL